MKPKPTREEIRELLREEWPSFFPIQPLPERITRAEVEVERLKKIAAKRKAAKR